MHNPKKIIFHLIVVFIGFFGLYEHAYALSVTGIRFGSHGDSTRIVLDVDAEADFRAQMQDNPVRMSLDLPALSGQPSIGRSVLPADIKDIRLEPLGDGHSRLNFIMARKTIIRSAFMMPAEGGKPARVVLDLAPTTDANFEKAVGQPQGTLKGGSGTAMGDIAKPTAPTTPSLPFATGSAGIRLDPVTGPKAPNVAGPKKLIAENLPLVMIDAGHGGPDSGAVGSGVQEKDVTLAVAREIRKALLATGHFRAELTRDKDVFIPLADRVKIARAADADLFVSVHADSVPEGGNTVRGASFYILSAQASDAQTARLAARENAADKLGGVTLPTDDQDVKEILIDLAMRDTTHKSRQFEASMHQAFRNGGLKTLPGPERGAGFMVLKAPDVPSMLIELGFLSNSQEAANLADPAYRTELGETVSQGIEAYFRVKTH